MVSILIPVYNAGKYLEECLDSVLTQTYTDIQICVVDDGSKDDSFEIIKSYADKDPRIEYHSRPNKGVAETRNELLDMAKGEHILFVDSDDWIEQDMVDSMLKLKLSTSTPISVCGHVVERNENRTKIEQRDEKSVVWNKSESIEKFLVHRELRGNLWNKLIDRSLFDGIRFYPEIGYGEDAQVVWRILKKVEGMSVTTSQFYHYRMSETSISHRRDISFKMSLIPVWKMICIDATEIGPRELILAHSRFGAELTLLLFEGRCYKVPNRKKSVIIEHLRPLLPAMRKSGNLSWKFLLFAHIEILRSYIGL